MTKKQEAELADLLAKRQFPTAKEYREAMIAARLTAKGLRKADSFESGWCVNVIVDGEIIGVWATDEGVTEAAP